MVDFHGLRGLLSHADPRKIQLTKRCGSDRVLQLIIIFLHITLLVGGRAAPVGTSLCSLGLPRALRPARRAVCVAAHRLRRPAISPLFPH